MLKSSEIKKTAIDSLAGNWIKAFAITTVFTIVNIALSCLYTFTQNATSNTPILYYGAMVVYIALFLPLSFGLISSIVKLISNNKKVGLTTFLNDAIMNWSKCIAIFIRTILGIIIPAILVTAVSMFALFVTTRVLPITDSNTSGYALFVVFLYIITFVVIAIAAIPYVLSSYALADDNKVTAKEAVTKSKTLMKKRKWEFIKLIFTFLFWIVALAILSAIVEQYTVPLAASFVRWIGLIFLLPYLISALSVFYEELCAESEVVIEDATATQPESEK